MERGRVKKKGGASKPGGAVMISGTSTTPPVEDTPVNMSDDKDLIMEYTDIFEPTDNTPVLDIQDGDAVEESSDTEIVGHSNENSQYAKHGNDSDIDTREGPPPLDSEDDYEYDDSDLCFSPPQVLSDYCESPLLLSPSKSISSERDSGSEKAPFINQSLRKNVSRQESDDSDLGYREGPPPLDSEGEEEGEEEVDQVNENGVDEEEDHDQLDENFDEVEETGGPEQPLIRDSEENASERTQSPEETDFIESSEPSEQTELVRSNSQDVDTPERVEPPDVDPTAEGRDPPVLIESPERVESPVEDVQEDDKVSDVGSSERIVTPEFGRRESESDDMFSNPEEPLLRDEESAMRSKSSGLSSQDVSENEEVGEPENQPLLREDEEEKEEEEEETKSRTVISEEESEDDTRGSTEALIISEKKDSEDESTFRPEVIEARTVESPDDDESGNENEGLLSREVKPAKEIFRKQKTLQNSVLRNSKMKSNISEVLKTTKDLRGKPKQSEDMKKKNTAANVEEKGRHGGEKKRMETSRPNSVASSTGSLSKKPKQTGPAASSVTTSATVHPEKKPRVRVQGAKDEKPSKAATQKASQDARRSAPGIAVKEDSKRKPVADHAPGKAQRTKDRAVKEKETSSSLSKDEKTKARHSSDAGMKQKRTSAEDLGKAYKRSSESLAAKRSTEKPGPSRKGTKLESNSTHNGEVKQQIPREKKTVTKSIAVGTDEETIEDGSQDERSPRARSLHQPTALHIKSVNIDSAKAKKHDSVKANKTTAASSIGVHNHHAKTHSAHGKHDRGKHIWLCRDDEIHKLIAQKASLLKEYESGSLAGRKVFSGQKRRTRSQENVGAVPDVSFTGNKQRTRQTRPLSEVIPERGPYAARTRETRRSLQQRYSGTSSEDEDERTDKVAGARRAHGSAGTFSVGMASRDLSAKQQEDERSDSEHEESCEYCQAEQAAKNAQERDLAWEGPHHPRNLLLGVVYTAKYLGSSQIMSPQSPNRAVRMQQAQEAVGRIKVPEGEDQPTTAVDIFISTERIKVVNSNNKEVMMDHALRTVSFIADIGDVLVLMARRPPGEQENPLESKPSAAQILASVSKAETDPKMIKITCHVFQADEAQVIAKSIGQAFNVAYQEFLKTNGISEDSVEDAEYNCVLEAQKILGEDLSLLSDESKARELVVNKKPGEALGVMIVESGWGSMIPTAIIAHLAKDGPAAKSGRVNVGDQILSVNNTSLVGLPLIECQNVIKNSRAGTKVVMKMVSCPPTVQVVVNRPDTKYQLGFSVQNGMICSLMRGSIAERGGVRVGHRIIEINGESVVATSHQHIVDLLATTIGEIRMKTMPASMYRLIVGLDTPQHI